MSERIDLLFEETNGVYDLVIGDDGDLSTVDNLSTAIDMSILLDRRADEAEIEIPERRRGWWGNVVPEVTGHEVGSKLWLFDQYRVNSGTSAQIENYVRESLSWIEDQNIGKLLSVTATVDVDIVSFVVKAQAKQNSVISKYYELWRDL